MASVTIYAARRQPFSLYRPSFNGLLSQVVIVFLRCNASNVLVAKESTHSNHIVHFHTPALRSSLNFETYENCASCDHTNQKQEIADLSWDTRLLGNMLQFKSLSLVRGNFSEELNVRNKRSDEFVLSLFQVFLESSSG